MKRELTVDQRHIGVLLLAGLIALTGTCLAGVLVVALVLQIADHPVLLLALFLPAIFLVLNHALNHSQEDETLAKFTAS